MKLSRALALALTLSLTATSSQAETISEALAQCKAVKNVLKRLACYDGVAQRAGGMQDSQLPEAYTQRPANPNSGAATASASVPSQQSGTRNTFGLEEQIKQQAQSEIGEITGVVGKVAEGPRDELLITLDDGQVWLQTDTTRFKLKSGDSVVIERGVLGAFYLKKAGHSKRIRVKRRS